MKAIVFDLDGTLIDSAPDIHASAVKMLADEGKDPLDADTIRSFIGNGIPKLVERVIAATGLDDSSENFERLRQNFVAHYAAAPADHSVAYPGLVDLLDSLKAQGYALGVCTNKQESLTVAILEQMDLAKYFSAVIGGDSLPVHKPDPKPLERTYEMLKATSRLYVGDSEVDAETAQNAGVVFALYTQGYRKSPVSEIPHQFKFTHFDALPKIIETSFMFVV